MSDFQALIESNRRLANAVEGKVEEIDSRIEKAEGEFNKFQRDIQKYIPLPLNLFSNAMMRSVEPDGHPTRYSAVGCVIEAVHPWTKGFEGVYSPIAPENVAPNVDSATKDNPFWFGSYNLGKRMVRGGLAGGWGGISSGKILKVTSIASPSSKYFRIPVETFGVFPSLGLRFWVKIVKGRLGVGGDNGLYKGAQNQLNNVINKSDTDAADDGWFLFDKVIGISQATAVYGNVLNFGLPSDEDTELYIALPFLYLPMAGKAMTVAAGETGGSPVFTPGS
ncbi:TPA: hypothetical protein ACMDRZ_003048 [Vibrio cholerae]|uniref:hypothetical protein n=1 Tax=Vibrio cholerae TaxID=666 RepID=UPI00158358BE|nr:hypothetical protein [Vibrio cholerae]QKU65648.1 hypothetical protein HPY17_20230 [Vibrio cholerae]QKU69452.1 hypothetical protein HPY10_19880 [Vibrio cholerae]